MRIDQPGTYLALALTFLCATNSVFAQNDYFVYQNCADQTVGPPLTGCPSAEISKKLDNLRVNHFIESRISNPSVQGGAKVLNSIRIPIFIPENFQSVGSWMYNGRKYLKSKKPISAPFYKEDVDVIIVIEDTNKAALDKVSSLEEFAGTAMFSFWYSSHSGVLAFGFPQSGNSGEVYFCTSKSCLFGNNN